MDVQDSNPGFHQIPSEDQDVQDQQDWVQDWGTMGIQDSVFRNNGGPGLPHPGLPSTMGVQDCPGLPSRIARIACITSRIGTIAFYLFSAAIFGTERDFNGQLPLGGLLLLFARRIFPNLVHLLPVVQCKI